MTSNGSYSDGTGYTPTSPTSTSPSLSARSIPTQLTSVHMSDSDSGARDSDNNRDIGTRPSRERKAITRYIAGLANQPTTLTQPTAASAARANARKSSQLNPSKTTSSWSNGQPATHSIRNRPRQGSNSVPPPTIHSSPAPGHTPLPTSLPIRVRATFAKDQAAAPSSPQAPGAFVSEVRSARNSPILSFTNTLPQSPVQRPHSAAEVDGLISQHATPSRAARHEESEVDFLLTQPGLHQGAPSSFLTEQTSQYSPPATSRLSRAHFSSISQFAAIPEDETWNVPNPLSDPRDDALRRIIVQLEDPEVEGELSLRQQLEGWATEDTKLEDVQVLPNNSVIYNSPLRPEDVPGLILTLQELISATLRLEGTRSKPFDLRGVDTLWRSFLHGDPDAFVIENIYKRRTLKGLTILDKAVRRINNEIVLSPATTTSDLFESRHVADQRGDLQGLLRMYSDKAPLVYRPRTPDSSLLFKGMTPSLPSLQDKENEFLRSSSIPLPLSMPSSPRLDDREHQSPVIVMATTTTTTTMPGLTSSLNPNAPATSTPSTYVLPPQTTVQNPLPGGSSNVQVMPATPIRGDRLGVPVGAPTGIAITPRSNVQWNSITPGAASISTGLPGLAPGQPVTVNLPTPLFSTAAQMTATPSGQIFQGTTSLPSASSSLPNTSFLNPVAGNAFAFNLNPTTTSALGSVGAPRVLGGPGLSPAMPIPATAQTQSNNPSQQFPFGTNPIPVTGATVIPPTIPSVNPQPPPNPNPNPQPQQPQPGGGGGGGGGPPGGGPPGGGPPPGPPGGGLPPPGPPGGGPPPPPGPPGGGPPPGQPGGGPPPGPPGGGGGPPGPPFVPPVIPVVPIPGGGPPGPPVGPGAAGPAAGGGLFMKRELKADAIPVLDNWDDVIPWFNEINTLVRMGDTALNPGTLSSDIAKIIPSRFDGDPKRWFYALDDGYRLAVTANWVNLYSAVVAHLGEPWQQKQRDKMHTIRFRQSGHSKESPFEYFARKLTIARYLTNVPAGQQLVYWICDGMPNSWESLIRPVDIPDIQTLLARAEQLASVLLSHSNLTDEIAAMRRLLDGNPSRSRHHSRRDAHAVTQEEELEDHTSANEDHPEDDEEYERDSYNVSNESSSHSRPQFSTPSRRGGRGGYRGYRRGSGRFQFQNKKWQPQPPANGYPFPRDDSKKSSNKPSYPCKACGSPWHYDPDCPHYEAYKAKRNAHAIDSSSDRPDDVQKYYDAEYTVTQQATIDNYAVFDIEYDHLPENVYDPHANSIRSLLDPSALLSHPINPKHLEDELKDPKSNHESLVFRAEIDTTLEETEDTSELEQSPTVPSDSDTDSFELDEETGKPKVKIKSSGSLPVSNPGEDEEPFSQPGLFFTSRYCYPVDKLETFEGEILPAPPPISDSLEYHPTKIRTPPDGTSCLGVSALIVKGHMNDRSEEEIEARIDSGADITLISESLWKTLKRRPALRQGLKMELYQLTHSAKISGYVKIPFWLRDVQGHWACLQLEAYVVPGMRVPLLIGEDTQIAYSFDVSHREGDKSRIRIGDANWEFPAWTMRTPTEPEAFSILKRPEKIKSYLRKARHQQSRRRKNLKGALGPVVRAAMDIWVKPHHTINVPVNGPFDGKEHWLVESYIADKGNLSFLATAACLINSSSPVVPVANLSFKRKRIRKGDPLGYLADPETYFDHPKVADTLAAMQSQATALSVLITKSLSSEKNTSRDDAVVPPTAAAADVRPCQWNEEEDKLHIPDVKPTDAPSTKTTVEEVLEDEDDQWGPKTAAVPENEYLPSSKLEELIDWGPEAPPEIKKEFFNIVRKNIKAFGFDGRLGQNENKAHIRTQDNAHPVSVPMYQASPAKREVIDKQLDAWFEQRVIEPSISPWAAPVVIVYRNGKARFCVDYRKLNAVTIADEHPIPRQNEIIQALSGAQVLSSMDALSGFTQIEIAEEDREKSAFRTHRGLFQFRRMPFGLRNGPAIFQRIMQGILAPFLWIFALVYIDDIVVYSKSWEEHLEHLDAVLGAIQAAGLTLSPTKCHFGYTSILLLGQKVSRLGMSTHGEKVQAIVDLARPERVPALRTFLGMVVYFSQYIPYYSEIVAPLFALLRKDSKWEWKAEHETAWKASKAALLNAPVLAHPLYEKPYRLYTDASDVAMGACLQQVQPIAIKDLRNTRVWERLKKAKEAGLPPPSLVTKLNSRFNDAVVAAAWNEVDWEATVVYVERVVAYWSRTFKPAERNYSATEREALGAKEGLVKFQPIIEGEQIILITDHAALQWARAYEGVNRRLSAWGTVFNAFRPNLDIVHRAGRVHSNVDPLSRLSRQPPESISPRANDIKTLPISDEMVKMAEKHEGTATRKPAEKATALSLESQVDLESLLKEAEAMAVATRAKNRVEKREEAQRNRPSKMDAETSKRKRTIQKDEDVADVSQTFQTASLQPESAPVWENPEEENASATTLHSLTRTKLEQFQKSYLDDPAFKTIYEDPANLLHTGLGPSRFCRDTEGLLWFRDPSDNFRLCIPRGRLRQELVAASHESPFETAHAGGQKLLQRLRLKYYWPTMRPDVLEFVTTCDVCQKIKPDRRKKPGLLKPLPIPERPYHTVTMDLITNLPISEGFEAILVLTDKLTKHVQFIPTFNSLSKFGFAKLFTDNIICRFGLPDSIVCDRDGRWMSEFWKAVADYLGSKMAFSSARHPQTDGQTERVNQTLEIALRAYVRDKSLWARWLPMLAHAYNSTPHDSTGYTPYFLLLGYEPRGPVDYVSGVGPAAGRPALIDKDAKPWLNELRVENLDARKAWLSDSRPAPTVDPSVSADFIRHLTNVRQEARDRLAIASSRQAKAYDTHRRIEILEPGDEVLINPHSLEWIESRQAGAKLVQRWTGPFTVQERISDTVYDIALPDSYPGSSIINIEHLKKYHRSSPTSGQDRTILPELRIDRTPSEEYEVESILTHAWSPRDNRIKYYVRWVGYSPQHDSWVSIPDMRNAKQLIRAYHERIGKSQLTSQREAQKEYESQGFTDETRGVDPE